MLDKVQLERDWRCLTKSEKITAETFNETKCFQSNEI